MILIQKINPHPLSKRWHSPSEKYVPHRWEYEFFVQLDDGSECTIWVKEDEVEEFLNGNINKTGEKDNA